ncbi:hypothetical protein COV18_03010 [Candidatus Woesearchaeota archaeon CG10_big_fil_rev_8_21_14_0_10_37_12]|nr:MAG: hypothetical protein COV18_03010 [Candidatus Woesearchaeota archaeon CG10_big_fil_rev_8_21_14_0_10_37_12]
MFNELNRAIKESKTVFLLSLIVLIPLLGIFYTYGYLLDVARRASKKKKIVFTDLEDDVENKFIRGLLVWVIQLAYFIPLLIIFLLFALFASYVETIFYVILAGILYLIHIYCMPAILITYCQKYKLIDAFSTKIFAKVFTKDYLIAMIYSALLSFAGLAVFLIPLLLLIWSFTITESSNLWVFFLVLTILCTILYLFYLKMLALVTVVLVVSKAYGDGRK